MIDLARLKSDVIILAGQSNAEGNGIRVGSDEYLCSPDVYMLYDKNADTLYYDDDGNLIVPKQMEIVAEKYAERRANGVKFAEITRKFTEDYIKDGLLEKGRKLLVIKAGFGGAGFAKDRWGVGNVLSDRMLKMTDYALSLNQENRIVAFLWHQGEHDAFEREWLSPKERKALYYEDLKRQLTAVRNRYSKNPIPVICGEMVNDWADKNKDATDAIEEATREVLFDIGFGAMVSSEGLLSNDQCLHNGDGIHFCAAATDELGDRYFAAYKTLIK